MLQALKHRDNAVAQELRRRIEMQRDAVDDLGKFAASLNRYAYGWALERLQGAESGFWNVEQLGTMLLELENDYVKAAARAQRSTSGRRFAPFWRAFNELARRRTHHSAESVYQAVLASGIPHPHPKLSVAKKRYSKLMRGIS
ncbi:hypothetical protein [Burkholderia sp. Ac-20353]|uniref:hypothetical protein n=1 Tax=Burkholderia sp. Ac-20353 TaxID=2703894 RepID=UPI00197B70AC|nr:hypothetical protein [Burkholderia sp. Ac-20353]MBN3789714.1 hypothetical protein [Burkholderia sp. Ac-20353]